MKTATFLFLIYALMISGLLGHLYIVQILTSRFLYDEIFEKIDKIVSTSYMICGDFN